MENREYAELENNKEPLTTGQIADYCHVTVRAVLKWIKQGKLKAYTTPGGHSRIRLKDFLYFLKKYDMPAPAELSSETAKANKILIVDDDKDIIRMMRKALEGSGELKIEEAHDGFAAGSKYLEFKPNLVILDIRMPGLDGYEVCAYIREANPNNKVKILVVSGSIEADHGQRALKAGANDVLEKPFDISHFKDKVARLLGAKVSTRSVKVKLPKDLKRKEGEDETETGEKA